MAALNDKGDFEKRPRHQSRAAKRWIVVHRVAYGPFDSADAAASFAASRWPASEEYVIRALLDPEHR